VRRNSQSRFPVKEATVIGNPSTGDVWADAGTASADASYADSSDTSSIAQGLAGQLNGGVVSAYASGGTVRVTSVGTGSGVNYPLSGGSETQNTRLYHLASFHISSSGAMSGGADGYYTPGTTAYEWAATSLAPDGDLLASTDTANGNWAYTLNDLGQLTEACTPTCGGTVVGYGFDRYGNLWSSPLHTASFTGNNNRMDGWQYNAAGDLTSDGTHTYVYDAENRIVSASGGGTTASYVYDAEGRRVHEAVNGVVKEYIYGASGQELTVVDGSQNLMQGETYFDGWLLAGALSWVNRKYLGERRRRVSLRRTGVATGPGWAPLIMGIVFTS